MPIRNRITRYGLARVQEIIDNPANWRIHPPLQRDALTADLLSIGMVQNVTINEVTGNLVDGHLRVSIYRVEGEESIPVSYVDLTPQEEATILAHLDWIGQMAEGDREKVDALLLEIPEPDNEATQQMMAEMMASADLEPPGFLPAAESSQPRLDQHEPSARKSSEQIECPHCGELFVPRSRTKGYR